MAPKKQYIKPPEPPKGNNEREEPPPPPPLPAIATPKEPVLLPPDPEPTFNEQWFDDPIEGEEAIRLAMELHQKIEVKAEPIRCFLEKSVIPLLLQGLGQLAAMRPNNPAEYLAAFLIKNNPRKYTYVEDDKPEKVEVMVEESDNEDDDLCGCNQFYSKKEPLDPTKGNEEPLDGQKVSSTQNFMASHDAKNATVVADATKDIKKIVDTARAAVVDANAKTESTKKAK